MVILLTRVKLSECVRLQLPLVSSRTELLGNCSLSTESSDWQLSHEKQLIVKTFLLLQAERLIKRTRRAIVRTFIVIAVQ